MIRMRIILTLLCLNAVLGTQCQLDFSSQTKTLIVQEQSLCVFPEEITSYLSELIHLEINGILVFSDSSPASFNLASLSFGQDGRLIIGDQKKQLQHPVVFRWPPEDKCPQQQTQGQIFINAPDVVTRKLKQTAYFYDQILILDQDMQLFQANQKIIVIDPENPDEMEEFTLHSIDGSIVTLNEHIKTTKFVYPSESISNSDVLVLFVPEVNQIGVFFINSCLSVNVETINGAIFMSPRNIKLLGGNIQNSLFYESTLESKEEEQVVSISSSQIKTYFISIRQVKIEQNPTFSFETNLFFQIPQLLIILQKESSHNQLIKCYANIQIPWLSSYKFTSYRFDASQVEIDNKEFQIIAFEYSTHFTNLSTFKAKKHLNSLVFADSFISNSSFDFSSIRIIDSIEFLKMIISAHGPDLDMFLLPNPSLLSDKISIFLSQSIVLGQFNSLFKQAITNPNHSSLSHDFEGTCFTIFLKHTSLIEDQQNSSQESRIFDLQNMNIMRLQRPFQIEYLVKVEDYNTDYLYQIQLDYKLIKDLSYFFTEMPSQYLFQVWLSADKEISFQPKLIGLNNQFTEYSFDLNRMQIFPGQTHRLFLNFNSTKAGGDAKTILKFSLSRKIQSSNQYETRRVHILTNKRPLKSFSVIERPTDKEFIYEHGSNTVFSSQNGVTIKLNEELNQVEISWNEEPVNDSHFIINLDYCNQNQFFENGNCVNHCTQLLQGLECVSTCSEGYYLSQDIENLNTCIKCSPECITCSNESTCDSCFLTSPDHQKCVDKCFAGEYQKERQCLKCSQGCLYCLNDQTCVTCESTFVDQNCKHCDKGFFPRNGECLQCNSDCEECFGETRFQCFSCKQGLRKVGNLCIPL